MSKRKIQIDIRQLSVRAFCSDAIFNLFDCSRRPINAFLKNKAKKVVRRAEFSVFTAHLGDSNTVVAYYALQIGSDRADDLNNKVETYLSTYSFFPAVNLAFLGVDNDYMRQGVGTFLLMDVLHRVALISQHVGFYGLTLTALDAEAKSFYKSIGFHSYPDEKSMRMIMTLREIIDVVNLVSIEDP